MKIARIDAEFPELAGQGFAGVGEASTVRAAISRAVAALFKTPELKSKRIGVINMMVTISNFGKTVHAPVVLRSASTLGPEFCGSVGMRGVDDAATPQAADPIAMLWPRAMRIELAAKYIGATPWAVEEMCRSGELVGYKQGNKTSNPWVIDRLELDRYVSQCSAEATELRFAKTKNRMI